MASPVRFRELPAKGAIDLNDDGTHTMWLDAKGRISTIMEDERWSKYPEWYWKDWQSWNEQLKQKKLKNAYNLMVRSKYHNTSKTDRDRSKNNAAAAGKFRSDNTTEKEDEEDRLLYEVDVLERALLVAQEQRHQAIIDLQQIHEMEYAIFQRLNEARRAASTPENYDQPIYPLIQNLPPAPNRTRRRSVSKSLSPGPDPTGLPQNITQEEMSAILADPANLELMHSLTEALASGGDVAAILAGINLEGTSGLPMEPAAMGDADMEQLIAKAMAGIPFEVDEDENNDPQHDADETRIEQENGNNEEDGPADNAAAEETHATREPSAESEVGDAWMAELLAQAGA